MDFSQFLTKRRRIVLYALTVLRAEPGGSVPEQCAGNVNAESITTATPSTYARHLGPPNRAGQIRSQSDLDSMARTLGVKYEVITSIANDWEFDFKITLTNNDKTQSLGYGTWGVFFTHIMPIQDKELSKSPNRSHSLDDGQWLLTQYQGGLFSLKPVKGFSEIKPGESKVINLKGKYWSISRRDSMPNWYMAAPGLNAAVIKSTEDGVTLPFAVPRNPKTWKRYKHDLYDPYTPQVRYGKNFIDFRSYEPEIGIIPKPFKMEAKSDVQVCIDSKWTIDSDGNRLIKEANFLKSKIKSSGISSSNGAHSQVIKLKLGNIGTESKGNKVLSSPEAYSLEVDKSSEKITIVSPTKTGVFYGIMSLLSVLNNHCAPQLSIQDGPRFEYRGLMLDIARNFHPAKDIIDTIKVMALYKLNKLHLHLSDDEAFRLEVPALPELTELGSKNCHDLSETECLIPQLGSKLSKKGEYLTTGDYQRILKAAQDHHIQVIPEIDMPGHARAMIKSMQLRMSKNPHATPDVTLTEKGDTSDYTSVQMFKDNAINPCLNSTYNFVAIIMDHLIKLHKPYGGLKVFHSGNDEVKPETFLKSKACNRLISQGIMEEDSHQQYFVKRVEKMASDRELTLATWEEGALNSKAQPIERSAEQKPFIIYGWNNVWEWWLAHRTNTIANAGYKVVMAHASFLYFDHPQEPDPEENGLYWAGRVTGLRDVFSYDAINLYYNLVTEISGKPIEESTKCSLKGACVTLTKRENIIGMQASLFGETVRTRKNLHEALYPRLLAFAHRAWHQAEWEGKKLNAEKKKMIEKDWKDFVYTVGHKELARLVKNGVSFWVPPPGAKTENGNLKTTTLFPGLLVQISLKPNGPWTYFQNGDKVPYTCDFWMRTKFPDADITSRPIKFVV